MSLIMSCYIRLAPDRHGSPSPSLQMKTQITSVIGDYSLIADSFRVHLVDPGGLSLCLEGERDS